MTGVHHNSLYSLPKIHLPMNFAMIQFRESGVFGICVFVSPP